MGRDELSQAICAVQHEFLNAIRYCDVETGQIIMRALISIRDARDAIFKDQESRSTAAIVDVIA